MSTNTAVATRDDRNSLEAILARPAYAKRFEQVLGNRSPQFMSSILSIGRHLGHDVEPKSIVGAAMKAACLNLPIEPGLGFAWIIAYREGNQKYAQFQMGFRGYIQLALRSNAYTGMNAKPINAEAFGGYDAIGDPVILWEKVDESKPAVGYAFAFRMINGFTKACYWPKAKVEAHARRYSKSYGKGSSPWTSHFDKMALKTVISNELSDWGLLSVDFLQGKQADQGIIKDIDADVEFIDNPEHQEPAEALKPEATAHQQATGQVSAPPNQPVTSTKQVNVSKVETVKPVEAAKEAHKTPQEAPTPDKAPETGSTPSNAQAAQAPKQGQANPPAAAPTGKPTMVEEPLAPGESTDPFAPENASPAQNQPTDEQAEAAMGLAPEQQPAEASTAVEFPHDPAFLPKQGDTDALASAKLMAARIGCTWNQLGAFLLAKKLRKDGQKLSELSDAKLVNIAKAIPGNRAEILALPK